MAHLRKGILGNPKGKIANIIGKNWKGIHFIQSKTKSGNNKTSTNPGNNGSKILQIALLWSKTKGGLSHLLKQDNPQAAINYNNAVKSILANYDWSRSNLITPMSFGISDFKDTVKASTGVPSGGNTVQIQLHNCNSIFALYPSAQLRYRYAFSDGTTSVLHVLTPKSNIMSIAIAGMPSPPGSWSVLEAFFWSPSLNMKSKVYMAAAIRS